MRRDMSQVDTSMDTSRADFSDRRAAKPNSTCLQCTWFFLSQGSIAANFSYESACSRTSFLMKRPIKVSKRSFNDCPKKGAIGASVWNLVTVSGSSHASLIVAYEAVCWAFLGVAWKDKTYFLILTTFGEPSLPQQHPLPTCEDKFSGGTLWTL